MTNQIYSVGADAGNSLLKMVMEGNEPLIIPSVYSIYTGKKNAAGDLEEIETPYLQNHIDVTISSPALTFNNSRYIVGQKVIDDKRKVTEMEKKSDKSTDELPVILVLSGIAINAMKNAPESNNININVNMSVSLPVQTITPDSAKRNAERFTGHHTVKFHHPSGREVVTNIHIEYARCLAESQAAAFGIVYDLEGEPLKRKISVGEDIREEYLNNRILLHYGIGGGTTEKVVTKGIRFNPNLSTGLPFGVKETIKEILDGWNHENPRKSISSTAEFDSIFLDEEHPTHLDLKEYAEPFIRQLSLTFSEDIINRIDEFSKDDPIVFIYGGGASVISSYLQQILSKKKRKQNVIFLKNPLIADAQGLLVYTKSPRFQQLKEQELGVVNV